jgi:hypothetical protein
LIGAEIKSAIGEEIKGYFEAEWSPDDGWKIGARVLPQKW